MEEGSKEADATSSFIVSLRSRQLVYVDQMIHTPFLQQLGHTTNNIAIQAASAAGGAAVGGAVGGKTGAIFGTLLGMVVGCACSEDYSGIPRIIANMSDNDRVELAKRVQAVIRSEEFQAFANWIAQPGNLQILMEIVKSVTAGTSC